MKIAEFAVKRPVAVIMRIAALVLLGAVCLTKLPVDLLPKVSLPTLNVSTSWPNVAPEEMETQITRPIERAVSSVSGLDTVTSTSSQGSSQVRIQFKWGTDIGQAAVDVLQLVERAKRNFPTDPTLNDPTVAKFDPNQMPIMVFGVSGEKNPVKLRMIMDNEVGPMVESADGVASVSVGGGQQRTIIVDVDPIRLRAYGFSLDNISKRLVAENINTPGGIAKHGKTEYTIRSLGWFKNVKEITNLPIGVSNGQTVRLSDLANVRDASAEVRSMSRLNGNPCVSLNVSKQSGANTVSTAESIYQKINQVKKAYPQLTFGVITDQSKFINQSVNDVKTSAVIGAILAILILLLFLRNIKSTLVVALSIPISIVSTFALLYMCGFTLNTMSLGGLALATGLIVDDAVVVLENIFRHIERDGKSAMDAAIGGTNEIVSAVVASTWTVMVVFLPLLLIKGQAGQMFTQFALVVIFSLAVSLLDATTVVPMLATRLISGEAHMESLANAADHESWLMRAFHKCGEWFDALDNAYRQKLIWALRHRLWVIISAGAILGFSLALVPFLGQELMPQTDSGDFDVNVKLPIGTALAKTDDVMRQVEKIVLRNPNVGMELAAAGTGRGTSSNQGSMTVKLKDNRKQSTRDVMGDMRKQFSAIPGVNPRLEQHDIVSSLMTGGNAVVEIDIFGGNLSTLSSLSKEVMAKVRDIPGYENLDVNWQDAMPEIQWVVDREKAARLGVSFSDVANTLDTATSGNIAGYYQEDGFQYPIQVQMPMSVRKTSDEMADLRVRSSLPGFNGQDIVLSQVAHPVISTGPSQITRQDRQRYIAVTGSPQGRATSEIQKDVDAALAGFHMPSGYYWDWGTRQKQQQDEFSGMWLAVVLAIAFIYMLLATQFESFIHPLTILFSVPLAATGVILGLFLTGRSFGLTAFIGVLMLVGIVVKNGILLVDYTNVLRHRGMDRDTALTTAGPTRLRPILMTASAAMLGMLPIAIGLGQGSEVQAPMATSVIGGLLTSTVLTLFVVPVVYSYLDDIALAISRRRGQS